MRPGPLGTMLALACGACAVAPPIEPGRPLKVQGQPVPSGDTHERCVDLLADESVAWRFEASMPVDFEVRFRDGRAMVAPLTRERSTEDRGRYVARAPRSYCLAWTAGAVGAMLDYTIEVRPR